MIVAAGTMNVERSKHDLRRESMRSSLSSLMRLSMVVVMVVSPGVLNFGMVSVAGFSTHHRRRMTIRTKGMTRVLPKVPTKFAGLALRQALDDEDLSIATKIVDQREKDEAQEEEELRLRIIEARRYQIRKTLKAAEAMRNFRIEKGFLPELDETGKPIKSDGKAAVTLTAFMVAAGAIALRIGGRAALISAVGLDMVTENQDLKDNLGNILDYANSLNLGMEVMLFVAAWTAVKVLCFDAGGVALALSAGILFGGVIPGAILSAAAATFGSSVAFGLAKLDTPVRRKALELLDEYPSLRGIEKVVAQDGLKAILTLRLAPILPIPIGVYNYIYGVTNVAYGDFALGIFLGSIKPYLLDSYLGYFGKSLVDGTAAAGDASGMQDIILLAALGFSVLIGVFASQLAGETWDSVLEELEAEKKAKAALDGTEEEVDDGVVREVMGWKLPLWVVGFQLSIQEANKRVNDMIETELQAQVWNYTIEEPPPPEIDPAFAWNSPEVMGANKGIDYLSDICTGLALSPNLMTAFSKYSDPLLDWEQEMAERRSTMTESPMFANGGLVRSLKEGFQEELVGRLEAIRTRTIQRIGELENQLRRDEQK